ncbi:MAG: serine hydrolase [Saprospiraceae bacterium]
MFKIGFTGLLLSLCIFANAQSAGITYELDTLFKGFHQRTRTSASILIARNDTILYQNALGYQNALQKVPLTVHSSFNLASVSKQFVTMCVMILKEQGKLQYDDLITTYLPQLPYNKVTIRHLMTHTAGLGDYFALYKKEFPADKVFTNKDFLELYAKHQPPLDFAPGEKYQYSNTGYLMLASIVEVVSGMRFQDFVTKHIIKPLKLKETFPYTVDQTKYPKNRVFGFEYQGDTIAKNDLYNIDGVIGDGNMYASVGDLQKWSQALYKNKLVKAETMREAYQPYVLNNGEKSYYGFGWGLQPDSLRVQHTGSWVGFATYIQRDLQGPFELIILTNSSARPGKLIQSVNQLLDRYRTNLITNVQIADGSGSNLYAGAVRVQGDKIVAIGNLKAQKGDRVIDGAGKVLAPGFIDTHSHHDRDMFEKRNMPEVVSQGVTTIVVGQDGGSYYPLREFWAKLDTVPVAVNVASYVGHNTLRRKALGNFTRPAAPFEITKMQEMLRTELQSGAIGLATGLEYDPGIYSTREEVLDLAKVLKETNKRYISHIRSEDRYFWSSIDEIINIGRTHRIPVQISHAKIAIVSQWGKADSLLQVLDQARQEGINITADVYPYEYWQSTMTVLFPDRNFEDVNAAKFALTELTTPQGMVIANYEADQKIEGKTLAQVAAERGQAPELVYLDLIKQALDNQADESVICTSMHPEDIAKIISWEWSNICSDGSLNGTHPRGAGSFPKIFRQYVREEKRFALPEAIRKMTALAAENMGFKNRGSIKPGYYADLVLFDPEAITDHATIQNPGALASGVLKVWVNGKMVWNQDKTTGIFPGRGLKAE